MTTRSRFALIAAVTLLVLVGYSAVAFGQTSSSPSTSSTGATPFKAAPLVEGIYQVQVAPEVTGGQSAVVVAVQIPPNTKLPAMVRIPVPQGAQPTWVGEILGGDPTADPQRNYRTVQGTGGQVLEVTAEQTHTVQAEFTVPSTNSGGNGNVTVTWIQSSPSARTEFSVRTPAGVTQAQITPTPDGQPQRNQLGETLYALPTKVMKPGETSAIAVTYVSSQTGQPGQQTSSASGGSTIFYVILIAFVVILGILGFMLARNRSR